MAILGALRIGSARCRGPVLAESGPACYTLSGCDIYTSLLVQRLIPCTVTEILTAFTSIKFRLRLSSLQNSLLLSLLSYKCHQCADCVTYLIVVVKVCENISGPCLCIRMCYLSCIIQKASISRGKLVSVSPTYGVKFVVFTIKYL